MKTIRCVICATAVFFFFSCRTLDMCGDVKNIDELPWLEQAAQNRAYIGQKLLSVNKIIYSIGAIRYSGFEVEYEIICCDVPYLYIYDCDGEVVTDYGGMTGCAGHCNAKVLSRKNIYTAK